MSRAADERVAFAVRLNQALQNAGVPSGSPTQLQRHFNMRGVTVTVHAARKWLVGEAIPTQDKLRQLAGWLEVDPHWLRFGEGEKPAPGKREGQLAPRTLRMLNGFSRLPGRDQLIVQHLVEQMLRAPAAQEAAGVGQ